MWQSECLVRGAIYFGYGTSSLVSLYQLMRMRYTWWPTSMIGTCNSFPTTHTNASLPAARCRIWIRKRHPFHPWSFPLTPCWPMVWFLLMIMIHGKHVNANWDNWKPESLTPLLSRRNCRECLGTGKGRTGQEQRKGCISEFLHQILWLLPSCTVIVWHVSLEKLLNMFFQYIWKIMLPNALTTRA